MYMATSSNGYWGVGAWAEDAIGNCKRHGGNASLLLFRLHDAWDSALVNDFGQIFAFISDERVAAGEDTPAVPVIVEAWEIGPRGKRTDVSVRFVADRVSA